MTYGRGGSVRAFLVVVLLAATAWLVGCSSGGGSTPVGVQITVSVSASPTSLNPGQSSTITATVTNTSNTGVTWSISPAGFGTLSSTTANPVTYTAPASVPTATTVTITATSATSSSVTGSVQIAVATSSATVSLSVVAPQTLNQGGSLEVTATVGNNSNKGVSWTISPAGFGSLSPSKTANPITYSAPASVTGNTTVTLTATAAASASATASLEITVMPSGAGPNVAAISVNGGINQNYFDGAFTSVTICVPGSSSCQTVDNVLVDTGSEGLRILASQIPTLPLTALMDSSGNTLNECTQFLDGSYLWGLVDSADVKIGSEVASSVPIQVVADPTTFSIPTACTSNGTGIDEDDQSGLGANGILGVGPEPFDCGLACDVNGGLASPPTPNYYTCNTSGCTAVFASCGAECSDSAADVQVTSPVILFQSDNNGVVIQFPALSGEAATLDGSLIFGIGTESNNGLGSATALTLDSSDNFETVFQGQSLIASFIDSGSNALLFPSTLTVCPAPNQTYYCPSGSTALSAQNTGFDSNTGEFDGNTSTVNFDIDNADNLFSANSGDDFAITTLGSTNGTYNTCTSNGTGSCSFDFGLPFFFGKSVFTAIDGQAVPDTAPAPPWFAY